MNDKANTNISGTIKSLSEDWFFLLPMGDVIYGKRPDMETLDLQRIHNAASNMLEVITNGLAAIGDLQWHACVNDEYQPEILTFVDIALLNKSLAQLSENLHNLSVTANYHVHMRELAAKVTDAT